MAPTPLQIELAEILRLLADLMVGLDPVWLFGIAIGLGFAILVWSADRFVVGAASIARNLGVSTLIIGLTIVGFGTSAPEILVSIFAALEGNPGLAIGNALGSNITNIGLILGVTALLLPIEVHSKTLTQETPLLITVCVIAYFLSLDGLLVRTDSLVLLALLALFLFWLFWRAQRDHGDPLAAEVIEEIPESLSLARSWWLFGLGLLFLLLSSRMVVWGAVGLAHYFGISDLIIGLTLVAFGTSLPELAASLMSAWKREDDLAIGNIVGSNMFNMLAVYSVPGLITPFVLERSVLERDFVVMLGLTVAMWLLSFGWRKRPRIGRLDGLLLLGGFLYYEWLLYRSVG